MSGHLSFILALFSSCMKGHKPPTEITHGMLHEFLYVLSCVCVCSLVQAGKGKLCKAWFSEHMMLLTGRVVLKSLFQ